MTQDRLANAIADLIRQPALDRKPRAFVVACSGGADSVALLRAAVESAPALGWRVEALHCDHGLRREAKGDAAFVAALCERLGVTLHAFEAQLSRGSGMEARARTWRQRCYAEAARRAGASLVLLAHHAQDQAETLLMNLVRGAGPAGAAAMQALSPLQGAFGILLGRPFLALSPEALRRSLRRRKQAWREDASNADTRMARNLVRHRVLPLLQQLNPKAVEHLAAFASGQVKPEAADLGALLRLDRRARERARALLQRGHGLADLGRGWSLKLSQGQAALEQRATALPHLPLRPGSTQAWGPSWQFQLKLAVPNARKLRQDNAFWFAAKTPALAVRAARAGERLTIFGRAEGSKLVHDILAEAKVPAWERAQWPALEAAGQLLALPPWRRGRGFEALAGQKALCLTWKTASGTLAGQP
jgi:tRNA(Ile)-lysidine synthetase-like protein